LGQIGAKAETDPASAFTDLTPFPLLQSVPVGKLLQRAELLTRWSVLVTSVLPLINLRSSAHSMVTKTIQQLRALIMPLHKLKFIEKVRCPSLSSSHPPHSN
jgi:hypothetical protein